MGKLLDLPDFMMPDDELQRESKRLVVEYKRLFKLIMEGIDGISQADAVHIIAQMRMEHIALMVGPDMTEYDRTILLGVIERYITGILIKE